MFKCKKCSISVQKATRRERAAKERERVHLCLNKFSPLNQKKKVLFLISTNSRRWRSGHYTSDAVRVELRTRVVRILYS